MLAPTIMIQGTASSVGKSLITAALCRMFAQDGLRVAPFKAQNMALNSAVTPDGSEIGRAQAVQAEAAGVTPTVSMNPILLKPEGERRSQVVVLGRPVGSMNAVEYQEHKPQLRSVVADALRSLRETFDLVVIEGAGSPAEINLKERDLVNMYVAKLVRAPVLLVGDIDRGGVFAAFVGTLELLDPGERDLVAAFVVNKFRGEVALLAPGLDFLTRRTGKPVLGVVPHVPRLRIADEDSVSLEDRRRRARAAAGELDIVVVRLPRISNYDDFEPLEHEPGVVVRFAEHADELAGADLVVLPGSKSTASDLTWLRGAGIATLIEARAGRGEPVLGVCGGCQMLGEVIEDPHGIESTERSVRGLRLLPVTTRFAQTKVTARVRARPSTPSFLTHGVRADEDVHGYEIHMGAVTVTPGGHAAFDIHARSGALTHVADGAVSASGTVVGTMIHGLFENDGVRRSLLRFLRERRGTPEPRDAGWIAPREAEYDRLAAVVRASLDGEMLKRIVGV